VISVDGGEPLLPTRTTFGQWPAEIYKANDGVALSDHNREFSRAIYADWGNLEIQDIHAVVDKLVADGLADPERLGIGGWSYGGMSTNYAIATDTRFAAGVSGAT
jgi:dipeptidyl aminopeptidase/acylaminoacyl peptidase